MENTDIQEIIKIISPAPSAEDVSLMTRAYEFAKKAHEGQVRFSGAPYFTHVFATAKNLARYEMDAVTISAGFLHDTLEDTAVTEDEMRAEFGEEIVTIVNGVTKLGKVKYKGHIRHIESMRKFLMAIAQDYRVLMVKLADRLHNLSTLDHIRPEKQKRIALESIEVYAPLADRLGIGKLKGEIEDLAFPFAYPKEAEETKKKSGERTDALKKSLDMVVSELEKELKSTNVHVSQVDWRVKHQYSLWKKLQRHNSNIDEIYDIAAVRVLVETVEECYSVLGIVHSLWKPLPSRIKDYIALPKLNGYQSLHTTVFTGDGGLVEVQIRTKAMHNQAEYGVASHYQYKNLQEKDGGAKDKNFHWVKEFKSIEHAQEKPEELIKTLKKDLFNDRIFVFTPKGDVIDLPKSSSVVDFAYSIHSDLGNTMSGARVNGKFVSLETEIFSGDIVTIETRKDGVPKYRWLDFAKTTIAKKHIRNYLNAHKKDEGVFEKFIPKRFR